MHFSWMCSRGTWIGLAVGLVSAASWLACTTEVIREITVEVERAVTVEVPVEREVEVVETVMIDRILEIPVPQTVLVEVPVLQTVVVEKEVPVEIPVPQTVFVDRQVTVEVQVPIREYVEIPVHETVIIEIPVRETVIVEIPVRETVIVEKVVTVEVASGETEPVTPTITAMPEEPTFAPRPPDGWADTEVVYAVPRVNSVGGLPTRVWQPDTTPTLYGGVEEYFFVYENGNPMTPELVDNWDIDPAGSRVRMTMKNGQNGKGIPFNSPVGYEDLDFGIVDADSVVRYFNEANSQTNPDTFYRQSTDLSEVFREARKIDYWTVEIDLVTPIFYCLPISQFGCLGAARGLFYLAHYDSMGEDWASKHHISTGPFVQGDCVEGYHCTTEAIYTHWRVQPNFGKFTQVQAPEELTRIAMLRNDDVDLTELDFKRVPGLIEEGYRFLETMPGGYIGQSILFPGNLWEHSHIRDGTPLEPWACGDERSDSAIDNGCGALERDGPYEEDFPWIGNPWGTQDNPCVDGDGVGRERCGNAPYFDTDNPPGIDDMEQARLVRLALSIAIDRNWINDVLLNDMGTPIYSEYMGFEYPGWDPERESGCWDWVGNRIDCADTPPIKGFMHGTPWIVPDGDLLLAGYLLDTAGYPLKDDFRVAYGEQPLNSYVSETGEVAIDISEYIALQWLKVGIRVQLYSEDYRSVISQRMRYRTQYTPILKNGDIHSNVFPLDWPPPRTDISWTRPGWGVGFESQAVARWFTEIMAEPDKEQRERMHRDWVDYSMYWVQTAGVFQIPKGVIAGPRIATWVGRQQHYSNVSTNPEFITLK